jgi:hypothetical protein
MRRVACRLLLALPVALGIAGCGKGAPRVSRLEFGEPPILTTWVNPATGERVPIRNGGYGSAIAVDPVHKGRWYLLTDRGPNYAAGGDTVAFVAPEFSPQIGVFERDGDRLIRRGAITLKDRNCKPLTGLPLPGDRPGATGEIGVATDGTPLPPDENGIDTEGLAPLTDGSFWVSDEYGPYLLHVDPQGCTLQKLAPGRGLPRVLAKRRVNRGLEGLTTPDDGKTLVAMLQAPLDNPRAAGRKSRLARILVLDVATGTSTQYAYLLDDTGLGVSDILSLGGSKYLVLERDGKFGTEPGAVKRFYEIDLAQATDVSDSADSELGHMVNGQTLEELTANASDPRGVLLKAGITPVAKRLALNILTAVPGYPHDKVEGATLIDPRTLAFVNDDDFGVTDEDGALTPKLLPGTEPRTTDHNVVVIVRGWR